MASGGNQLVSKQLCHAKSLRSGDLRHQLLVKTMHATVLATVIAARQRQPPLLSLEATCRLTKALRKTV
jgi:hypothetical protein